MPVRRSRMAGGARSGREVPAADRGYRRRAAARIRRRDPRGPRLARARLGRGGAAAVRAFRRIIAAALDRLAARGCSTHVSAPARDIAAEIARAGGAPQGEDGPTYPGTCRQLGRRNGQRRMPGETSRCGSMWRAPLARPARWLGEEERAAPHRRGRSPALGDVVLARKEMPTSYHLAVTVDDALQGVTLVTRGDDLRRRPISIACCRRCSICRCRAIAITSC